MTAQQATGAAGGEAVAGQPAGRQATSGKPAEASGDAADGQAPGPMTGYRVVELASERCAFAGKLLADMGADVVVVEPPGGCPTRAYEPFAGDEPGLERSLWWWHYNTSKRSVVVDLETAEGAAAFRRLVGWADLVIEAEPVGRLDGLGLDWQQLGDDGAPRPHDGGSAGGAPRPPEQGCGDGGWSAHGGGSDGTSSPPAEGSDAAPSGAETGSDGAQSRQAGGNDGAPSHPAEGSDATPSPPQRGGLVWVSITHNGRSQPDPPATDLTLLAEGGPVHSCGYDDHSLPPVRGSGNQAFQAACEYAVVGLLAALFAREETGWGQLVDVSMLAAANVTTEFATLWWLNQGAEVQRQTGRHALPVLSEPTQVLCADGRWLNSGVPPRRGGEFAALAGWVRRLGLVEECPYMELLAEGEGFEWIDILDLDAQPMAAEVFGAGRDTVRFLAERLGAYELFVGLQGLGLACGVVYAPEEMLVDEHFVERGWPAVVPHDGFGEVTYPGAPYRFGRTRWRVRRAPRLGEHQGWLEGLVEVGEVGG